MAYTQVQWNKIQSTLDPDARVPYLEYLKDADPVQYAKLTKSSPLQSFRTSESATTSRTDSAVSAAESAAAARAKLAAEKAAKLAADKAATSMTSSGQTPDDAYFTNKVGTTGKTQAQLDAEVGQAAAKTATEKAAADKIEAGKSAAQKAAEAAAKAAADAAAKIAADKAALEAAAAATAKKAAEAKAEQEKAEKALVDAKTAAELQAAKNAIMLAEAKAALAAKEAADQKAKLEADAKTAAAKAIADAKAAADKATADAKAAADKNAADLKTTQDAAKAALEKAIAEGNASAIAAAKAAKEAADKAIADAKAAADKAALDAKTANDKAAAEAKAAAAAAIKAAQDAAAQAAAEAAAAKANTNINVTGNTVIPFTGQTAADIAAQLAADKALEQKTADRIATSQMLSDRFQKYNLSSLAPKIKELAINGANEATIMLELQETEEYKQRFKANQDRIKKGLAVLDPGTYLRVEDGYRQVLREYGLKQFDTDDYVSKFIANDMSPTDLSKRVVTAVQRVQNADPALIKQLNDFYGINSQGLLAYVLDPEQEFPKIERQIAAGEIGVAAGRQGLQVGVSVADQLAAQGITEAEAQKGYATIADILPTAEKLSSIYGTTLEGYGQSEGEQEVFNSLASAQRKRQKLTAREIAAFSGSAGAAKTSLSTSRVGQYQNPERTYRPRQSNRPIVGASQFPRIELWPAN